MSEDRIDHAAEAVKQVENVVGFGDATESGSYEESAYVQQRMGNGLAVAQVHATLAVAEQLRVANLIAYTTMLDGQIDAGNARGEVDVSFAVTQDELDATLMRREQALVQAKEALGFA